MQVTTDSQMNKSASNYMKQAQTETYPQENQLEHSENEHGRRILFLLEEAPTEFVEESFEKVEE